tara:strand:+ start:387 stop:797 length:411 start_codon:yes stop_codon:yes gene_type:complete
MTDYKKRYNRLKVQYDIIRRGEGRKGGKQSLRPKELFETLQELYINKLDRMDDQQHILSKQTNILNQKDKEIDNNDTIIKSNITKIQTKNRKNTYNESNDRNSKSYIKILNIVLTILSVILIILIGLYIRNYRNNN